MVTVFMQGLSRSTAAAIDLLGDAFGGIVVSDRFSVYNYFPLEQQGHTKRCRRCSITTGVNGGISIT